MGLFACPVIPDAFRRRAISDSNRYDGLGPAPGSVGESRQADEGRDGRVRHLDIPNSRRPGPRIGANDAQRFSCDLIFSMMTRTSANYRDPASRSAASRPCEVPEDRDGQRIDNFLTATPQRGAEEPRLSPAAYRPGAGQRQARQARPRLRGDDEVRIPPVRVAAPSDPGTPASRPDSHGSRRRSSTRTAISSFSTNRRALPAMAAAASVSARSNCCARRDRAKRSNSCIGSIATPAACWCFRAAAPR